MTGFLVMCGFELLLLVVVVVACDLWRTLVLVVVACDLWRTLVLVVEGVVAVAFVVDDM